MSVIKNKQYKRKTHKELWSKHRELFGNDAGKTFPLWTKITDLQDRFSVQVYPDDTYNLKNDDIF